MADILKFMHCGCEYNFCSTKACPFTEDIFGDGSDGDCHITYNAETAGHVTIPAQEYNFCNLCIDENVTLHFCGKGTPILKVKECFINNGTIQLRNPLLCENYDEYIQGLNKVVHNRCNYCYDCACAYYNCEYFTLACLSGKRASGGGTNDSGGKGGDGGGAGQDGNGGCTSTSTSLYYKCNGGAGGTSSYSNAGGGGGGGGDAASCSSSYIHNGCPGCPAPADGIGGKGGDGCNTIDVSGVCAAKYVGGGGGGGYGYCQGGDGGMSYICYNGASTCGGAGGNSYLGNGGNGGLSTCGCGGAGGDTYYGNGGNGGKGKCGGRGGNTIYGNGGNSGAITDSYAQCRTDTIGGSSIFGTGGSGVVGGNGLDGGDGYGNSYGRGGIAWGGVYGLGLFANNIEHNGLIFGRGGDAGYAYSCNCTYEGTDGAEIYIVVGDNYCASGEISCRAGGGGCYSGGRRPSGKAGFVKFYHI